MARTLAFRIRATVAAVERPVTSPASVTELFVAVATMLLRPAPLPKKAPANLLFALARELTPLNVLEPVNVWLPLSKGTLAESRASGRAPDDTLAAFRVVRLAPLPLKVPANLLFKLVKELTPLKVLEPVNV